LEKKVGRWTIKGSERLYRDEFVEFWVDEVVGPDGKPGRRAVTKMLPGVSVLALDEEGFVYLVRTFRYAVGHESIETVAGAIEEGEEPEDAARRELREELGIEAGELLDLGHADAVTSQVLSPARLFLARGLTFKEPEQDSTEDIKPHKVRLKEAVRMAMSGEITQALSGLLIMKTAKIVEDEAERPREKSPGS
jgi:8-oxo-dGTP pyrophosphatase MutT (NUDIX family)